MTEVTLASLAMDFDVRSAAPATQQTDQLRTSVRALEEQAKSAAAAMRDHAVSQGLSGTAAGRAVQAMAPLVGAWTQARDALGRFTAADGSFRLSQDLTAKMLLQNANAATAYARQHEQAAKAVAKAEADAARAREADMNATAALLIRNAKLQDDLRLKEEQAAKTTASYAAKVDQLRATLDPFAAVQLRLAQNTRLLDEALTHGAITADQHAAALSQVTRASLTDVQALDRLQKAHGGAGEAARLQSYQLLNLGRQGADVFVSLASGQALWMVAVQQGAQIGEVFAEAKTQGVGFKAALAGIAAQVGPMLAVVGPIIAIGGAIAIVTKAAIDGEAQVNDFANAVALTGNAANLTGEQYEQMVARVALSTQSGFGTARETILGLVASGKVSGDAIETLALDIVNLSEYTGKSTDEISKRFLGMKGSVADFAREFHDDYNGLISPAVIKHIGELEEQGKRADATRLLYGALLNDLAEKGPAKIGVMESAFKRWNDVLRITLGLLSGIANEQAGKAAANQVNAAQLRNQINSDKAVLNGPLGFLANRSSIQAQIDDNQRRLDALIGTNKPKPAASSAGAMSATATAAAEEAELRLRRQIAEADKTNADARLKLAESVARADAVAKGISGGALDNIAKLARQAEQKLIDRDAASAARRSAAAGARTVRADNRGDNEVERAVAAELSARASVTKSVEELAGIKRDQIAQELTGQKVRLAGLVEEKRINDADAKSALASYERVAAYKRQALDIETANQIAQRDLQQRQEVLGYTQRVAQLQAAAAPTLENSFEIQSKALAERQAFDRDALQEAVAQRVISGDITLTAGKLLLTDQKIAQAADREDQDRQKRLAIFARDLELAQAAASNQVDILNSRKGLAQSSYAAAQIERQILNATYTAERDRLSKIIANKDTDAKTLTESQGRLATIEEIHRNELRQLELSDNAVTAYADLVGALSNAARSVIDGDIGGSISAAGGVLKQLSGLTGSAALATAASYAGPIGAAVSAVTGVLGAIGDRSAAKAQAKIDRLTKAVEDLRADNKTSSGSIAAALAEANANWNSDLEYSSAMLTALRSIDAKTGAVASLVARQVSTGGLLSTSGLGLGSTSSTGGIGNGLLGGLAGAGLASALGVGTVAALGGTGAALGFGAIGALSSPVGLAVVAAGALVKALTKTKTTTEILDQGLTFTAQAFGDIAKNGLTGSTYADLLTTTKKSLLGVGYSTKVKTSTVNGSIDPTLLGQIGGVIQALGDGVLSAAAVFGVEAAQAAEDALGSAVVDLGKLSLKGLKSDEIAEVLNATFDKVGDQLAAAGVPGLDKLADVGEGAFETLTRLAREYQVVDVALASIGKTFGQVGLASIAARDDLVKLFGGVDAFTSSTSFFASNFLTDAEQLAPVIKAVNDSLKAYGLSAESTRDQFAKLVLAQDLTTESGRAAYAALLAVAPAFDKVASAAENAAAKQAEEVAAAAEAQAKAIKDAYDEQARIDAYLAEQTNKVTAAMQEQAAAANASANALAGIVNKFTDLSKTLNDFADSLGMGELSGVTGQAAYAASKARLMSATGEETPDAIRAFLEASKSVSTSSSAYRSDVAYAQALARQRAVEATQTASFFGSMFSGLPGFATGGDMVIGGNPGIDQNLLSINGQPTAWVGQGETMSIKSRGASNDDGQVAALKDEIAALRSEMASMRDDTRWTAKVLKRVSPDGDSLQVKVVT